MLELRCGRAQPCEFWVRVRFQAEVAQLVEQPIRNRQVPGSSPGLGSISPIISLSRVAVDLR
jgi:hypothetical protein